MSLSGMLVNTISTKVFGPPTNVGGTNVPSETITAGVKASIQESSAAARSDQDIEGTTAGGKAFFDRDPGVKYGDQLLYGSRVLVCQNSATDEAGRGVLFTVRWIEIT